MSSRGNAGTTKQGRTQLVAQNTLVSRFCGYSHISVEPLIKEILDGIFRIIKHNNFGKDEKPDIKLHRKAFVLLMLMIGSEDAKRIVHDYMKNKRTVSELSAILSKSKKDLDNLIRQKSQNEEENKLNPDGGNDEYKA